MREIKFRGKRIDNGEWVIGSLINDIFFHTFPKRAACYIMQNSEDFDNWGSIAEILDDYEVIPETVGQYTNMKDKNGVEIYDGDLLSTKDYPGDDYWLEVATSEDAPHNFIIGYRKKPTSNVRGISDGIFERLDYSLEDCEVIGNIHDAKEAGE